MSRDELLIWAAGFFDGEGCVSISCSKKGKLVNYYTLQLTAYQNVSAPLDIFVLLFGGHVSARSEGGAIWQQTGIQTINTLSQMLPYLIVKRAQAEVALAFQRRKVKRGGKYPDPVAARDLDGADFQQVRALKLIRGG